MHVNFSK